MMSSYTSFLEGRMEKTVVELFAGVGGFRVGLNQIKSFDKVTGLARERERE